MSKAVSFMMWVSVIPNKIYNKWVKRGWIKKGATDFGSAKKKTKGHYVYRMIKGDLDKFVKSKSVKRRLKLQGFEERRKTWVLSKLRYDKMREEVAQWYNKVFNYITKWLTNKGYIKLKQGSFSGGFCVETNPDRGVVKNWGAPLADEGNKVVQIKEKFGQIRVYFYGLTDKESKEIERFKRHVEKKFDCSAIFG